MGRSRREFLKSAASAGFAAAPLATLKGPRELHSISPDQRLPLFEHLPGDIALKVLVPAKGDDPGFVAQFNSSKMLFVARAIKTFVLCEALRQADSPDVVESLESKELTLDSTVWSFASLTFTPPDLSGIVSERTVMEAMITRSDNTPTDMMFKLAGANNVRQFIASAGLTHTLVPDSTRALSGYLVGEPNYLTH
jgi:beta-lactamase class A